MMCAFRRAGLFAGTLAMAMATLPGAAPPLTAQTGSPAAMAAKLNGRWKLNAESTPASPPAGRGRGPVLLAAALAPVQRGGGGRSGGGSGQPGDASAPLTAEEAAAQAALSVLHQVPLEMTIEATAETVTFREPRGEWHFTIDGTNRVMDVPGGTLKHKSRWDRSTLRQEFSSAQKKLVKSWSIDTYDRLILTERYESLRVNSESKVVFDRQ